VSFVRFGELAFLAFLVLYHLFLVVPRHRRLLAANYLIFVAGLALSWNLAMEGLRWQTWPPLALFLVDLVVLFPTMARLQGEYPTKGWWAAMGRGLRSLVALVALVLAVGSAALSVAFPLPDVPLTGGLSPSYRMVRFPPEAGRPGLQLEAWYPASGDTRPQPRPEALAEAWQRDRAAGGLPVFWQSYREHQPTKAILGGRLATPKSLYPVVVVSLPVGRRAGEWGYLWEDLASRGYVVAVGSPLPSPLPEAPPFSWEGAVADLAQPWRNPRLWLEPEARPLAAPDAELVPWTQAALAQLAKEPGDVFFGALDLSREALWWGGSTPTPGSGWRAVIRIGGKPDRASSVPTLWISPEAVASPPAGHWVLTPRRWSPVDLMDAAYQKPFLAWAGLKSQADAGMHPAYREYQAAFLQHALWGRTDSFTQTVPRLAELTLTGN